MNSRVSSFMKRNGVTFVILIVVIIVITKVGKLFSGGGLLSQEDNTAREKQDRDAMQSMKIDESKMTKTMLAINSIADILYAAMDDFGTDEGAIFAALKGLNEYDLKALWKVFGYREESVFGATIFRGNLFDWFQTELSAADFEKIKVIFSKTGLL